MVAGKAEAARSITLVYEVTEEALQLLDRAGYPRLAPPRRAASEAAYYLSDTIEPDDRAELLAAAEHGVEQPSENPAGDALGRLERAAGEVERLLRGPEASSELRIGLRALRWAVSELAGEIGLARSQDRGPGGFAGWRRGASVSRR
jgi:hypothetical protein